MHRQSTLKQRMVLCLTAFFAALAVQIVLSFYQSGTVLRELDDQMGNFNAISRFQNGVERSLTALDDYRWESWTVPFPLPMRGCGASTAAWTR